MLSGFSSFLFGQPSDEELCTDPSVSLITCSAENNEWILVDNAAAEELVSPVSGDAVSADVVAETNCSTVFTVGESPPSSISSTPAKSDTSSANYGSGGEEPTSDFECFHGPYFNARDLLIDGDEYAEQHRAGSEIGALSDVSSQPEHITHASVEECWIVTPPPCFVGVHRENITTSPLEDLLIEHPSMSVYDRRRIQQPMMDSFSSSITDLSPVRSQSLPDREPVTPSPVLSTLVPHPVSPIPAAIPVRRAAGRTGVLHVPVLLAACGSFTSSWSASTARTRRDNARSLLDRRNRVCSVSTRAYPCRRNQRVTARNSGINNNRHCQ